LQSVWIWPNVESAVANVADGYAVQLGVSLEANAGIVEATATGTVFIES
jgi:hypothetical protein